MPFMLEKVRRSSTKLMSISIDVEQYIVDHQNQMDLLSTRDWA